MDLLIAQHPGDIGEIAIQLLHDFLTTGEPLDPKEFVTGATIVTRDNIEDPEVARYLYVADCANYGSANASAEAGAIAGGDPDRIALRIEPHLSGRRGLDPRCPDLTECASASVQ